MTKARDYGKVSLAVDGAQLGQPFDGYNSPNVTANNNVAFGSVQLGAGTHQLTFTLVGKNPSSINYFFGIDYLQLVKTNWLGSIARCILDYSRELALAALLLDSCLAEVPTCAPKFPARVQSRLRVSRGLSSRRQRTGRCLSRPPDRGRAPRWRLLLTEFQAQEV